MKFLAGSFTSMSITLQSFFLIYQPGFLRGSLKSNNFYYGTLWEFVGKAQIFTFPPYFLYFFPRNFFFLQIFETYCKKPPNGEFMENIYLVVWSNNNTKNLFWYDLFPQKLEYCGIWLIKFFFFN